MKKTIILLTAYIVSLVAAKSQNIITIAGDVNQGFSGDGMPATSNFCELNFPDGVYVDKEGNIYIGDELNEVVRMINTNGIIITFAGNHLLGLGYSGDKGPATSAQLNNPVGVCGDASGNIYIAEYGNNVIRKVSSSGIISTYAGTGIRGFSGDGGQATAAQLYWPVFIHIDIHGNLYIADYGNSRIRKVNTSGIISTIAGNGKYGFSKDGGLADTTELHGACGACADSAGNIYIVDTGNERIRKINTTGIISTIAGNGYVPGYGGFSGDGGPATDAELGEPADINIDASGNIFITLASSMRVREIDASGIITSIAGNGIEAYSGNGGPATDAELYGPAGICADSYGNILFTDQGNEVVRKIVYNSEGIKRVENNLIISIYPNPTNQTLNVKFNRQINGGLATLSIMDITGREMLNNKCLIVNERLSMDVSSLTPGMYFVSVNINKTSSIQKFIKN